METRVWKQQKKPFAIYFTQVLCSPLKVECYNPRNEPHTVRATNMILETAQAGHIKIFTGDKEEKTHLPALWLECLVPRSHLFNWLACVVFPTQQK